MRTFIKKRLVPLMIIALFVWAGSAAALQDPMPACAVCKAKPTKGPDGRWTIVHEKWCKYYNPPAASSGRAGGEVPPASATPPSPSTVIHEIFFR